MAVNKEKQDFCYGLKSFPKGIYFLSIRPVNYISV
jgi:hypothetical protein